MSTEHAAHLTACYRQALLYALTTPVDGVCSTSTAVQVDPQFDVLNDDAPYMWNQVAAYVRNSSEALTPARLARLKRINAVFETCDFKTLKDGVESMEELHDLQSLIGTATPSSLRPKNAAITRPLIRSAIPWEMTDPDLQVGQNGSFFGYSKLHPTTLNNCLILGGTGSGKSQSVIIPLLNAMLRYELNDGTLASMLVVDPKRELESFVRAVLAERGELHRLVVIGECAAAPIFAADSPLSMSDRLAKLEQFGPVDETDGNNAYWKNLGASVILDMMQLEAEFARNTGGKRLTQLLCEKLSLVHTENSGYWQKLRALFAHTRTSQERLKDANRLLRLVCSQSNVESLSIDVMTVYTGDAEMLRQWCYAIQSVDPLINALANPEVTQFVDLDPIQSTPAHRTDIPQLMECGKIILFSPEPRDGHRIAAMALKQRFFESVFSRKNLRRPIGVIIDEAQLFITNDKETGEQNFLDRCRAYRCIAAIATQSISSLKYALGSNASAQTAIDIVTANTPSKFLLRTTDVDTVTWLKSQLPQASDDDPHVIDVRRPASLRPGEAYFMLADGTWGRRRASMTRQPTASNLAKSALKGPL